MAKIGWNFCNKITTEISVKPVKNSALVINVVPSAPPKSATQKIVIHCFLLMVLSCDLKINKNGMRTMKPSMCSKNTKNTDGSV